MPDTNLPTPTEASSTGRPRQKSQPTSSGSDQTPSSPHEANAEGQAEGTSTTHITAQSKGGVGKTFIASLITQYLLEKGRPVLAFDVDPGNKSLARIKGLNANVIDLFNTDTGNASTKQLDLLMQAALTEQGDVVIDSGASSFQPLTDYLVRVDAPSVMNEFGRNLLVHSVIIGEPNTTDTLMGAKALLDHLQEPAKLVIWLNAYFGPVSMNEIAFEETEFYLSYRNRIAGVIRLERKGRFFEDDISDMLKDNLTFEQAIRSAHIMPAQRLVQVRRAIWKQLDRVIG